MLRFFSNFGDMYISALSAITTKGNTVRDLRLLPSRVPTFKNENNNEKDIFFPQIFNSYLKNLKQYDMLFPFKVKECVKML